MNQNLLKFNLFGIPVHIHLSFIFLCILITNRQFDNQANTALVLSLFVAILGHELGHASVLRRLKIPCEIHLLMFGGETVWNPTGVRFHHSWEILLNASGVTVNILIALICFLLRQSVEFSQPFVLEIITFSLYINLFLAILNLFPVLPLDGGKLFHNMVRLLVKPKTAVMLTLGVSFVVALLTAVGGLYIFPGSFLLPILFGYFAFNSFKSLKAFFEAQ